MEPDERFEIQLSHMCNNRCVFCVSGQETQLGRARPTPLDDLTTSFDEARARGIRKVTIMGGEPTIHPTFFPILDYAIKLGFETIVIFTNGARFNRSAFIDQVLERGRNRFQWRISIQGWDQASHDFTTKKRGSFARIVKGLGMLAELDQHISCNMCVVEENYRSLAKLPEFVTHHTIRQVHLDMVRPRDSGTRTDDYLDGIMPDYVDLGRVLGSMFEELERVAPDFDLNIGNLPFCHLPGWSHRIHHGGAKTFTVSAEGPGEVSKAWDKYADKRSDKKKLDSCAECVFEARCDGFVGLYAERRGTAAFVPVGLSRLGRVDPDQRAFVHHVGAALRSLPGRSIEGFWLAFADESERDRQARLVYRSEAGAEVTMLVLPAETPDACDGRHRVFSLRIEQWKDTPGGQLVALAEGVYDALAVGLGLGEDAVIERPSFESFRQRIGLDVDLGGLPRVIAARLGVLLSRSSPAAGFSFSGVRAHPALAGVSVSYSSQSGLTATLHLVEEQGRFKGNWDFGRLPPLESRRLGGSLKELMQRPRAPVAPAVPA